MKEKFAVYDLVLDNTKWLNLVFSEGKAVFSNGFKRYIWKFLIWFYRHTNYIKICYTCTYNPLHLTFPLQYCMDLRLFFFTEMKSTLCQQKIWWDSLPNVLECSSWIPNDKVMICERQLICELANSCWEKPKYL